MAGPSREWEWIVAQLSENISPEDEVLLNNWLNQSSVNRSLYEDAAAIWKNSTIRLELEDISVGDDWELLKAKIDQEVKKSSRSFLGVEYVWLAMAASLIFFIIFGRYFFERKKMLPPPEEGISVLATNEVVTTYLPDSTQVWLNTNSSLRYSHEFGKSERRITLTGEAFFKVTRDSARVFTVDLPHAVVQVLGTSFNVQEKDSAANVVVVHGKVDLSDKASKKHVILTAGERGIASPDSVSEQRNESSSYADWRKKNNPRYASERMNPTHYLKEQHTWQKSPLNQTVIEGYVENKAALATYKNVVLRITYKKPTGKETYTLYHLDGILQPGQRVAYKKRLLDIFTMTQNIRKVEFESVELVP